MKKDDYFGDQQAMGEVWTIGSISLFRTKADLLGSAEMVHEKFELQKQSLETLKKVAKAVTTGARHYCSSKAAIRKAKEAEAKAALSHHGGKCIIHYSLSTVGARFGITDYCGRPIDWRSSVC